MRKTQSRARHALSGPAWQAGALLVVMIVLTACGAPSAPPASVAQATAGVATQPALQATTGTEPSAPAGTAQPGNQEAGASASLNPAAQFVTHWKGDPNAKVVIVEVSDFQ